MSCDVPMETFTSAPFNLPDQAAIEVKASSWDNNGWEESTSVGTNNAVV
jgi:hypothetical protein